MKKAVISISMIFIFSLSLICLLIFWSGVLRYEKSAFLRLFPSHFLSDWKIIDIDSYPNVHIIGLTFTKVYLQNSFTPTKIVEVDYTTTATKEIILSLDDSDNLAWGALKGWADSSNIILMEGLTPTIFNGNFNSRKMNRKKIDSIRFTDCLPISKTSFVLKSYDSKLQQNILVKETLTPHNIKYAKDILEKQVDGLFCTDGEIQYSKNINRLVYVYRYRNQFICLDTSLQILFKGRTIDTVSKAKIKIAQLESGGKKTYALASPPLVINKSSCVSGDYLFIHSNRLAKNESVETFNENSVVDVYSLNNGEYKFSFYIPQHDGYKMKNFRVSKDKLIILYDHHLVTLNINYPESLKNKEINLSHE